MNSIDSQNVHADSTLPLSNDEPNTDNSIIRFPNCSQFLSSFNQNQPFSLPDSIIHYISKNPSTAHIYAKMIQSCKYFFIKNPILLVSVLHCSEESDWSEWDNITKTIFDLKFTSSKYWIVDELISLEMNKEYFSTSVIPKIFKCDAYNMMISNKTLLYDEFVFLCSNASCLNFENVMCTVIIVCKQGCAWNYSTEEHGTVVPFEKIFATLSKIECIYFDNAATFSTQTFKELLKIPQFLQLDALDFGYVSESLDIENWYSYMKKNKRTDLALSFSDPFSEVYKNRLEEIVDEIIETPNPDYKIPLIETPLVSYKR